MAKQHLGRHARKLQKKARRKRRIRTRFQTLVKPMPQYLAAKTTKGRPSTLLIQMKESQKPVVKTKASRRRAAQTQRKEKKLQLLPLRLMPSMKQANLA